MSWIRLDLDQKRVLSYKSGLLKGIKRGKWRSKWRCHDGYQVSIFGRRRWLEHEDLCRRFSNGNLKLRDLDQEVEFYGCTLDHHVLKQGEIVERLAESLERDGLGPVEFFSFKETTRVVSALSIRLKEKGNGQHHVYDP